MDLKNIFKENPDINITVKAIDLLNFGENIAKQTAQTVLNNHDEKVYTRVEVMEKFDICSATLWRWNKMGLITGKKLGNRLYYRESEIKRILSEKGGR